MFTPEEVLTTLDPEIDIEHKGLDGSVTRESHIKLSKILTWTSYDEAVKIYPEVAEWDEKARAFLGLTTL